MHELMSWVLSEEKRRHPRWWPGNSVPSPVQTSQGPGLSSASKAVTTFTHSLPGPPCPLLCSQPRSFSQPGLPLPCFRAPEHKHPAPCKSLPSTCGRKESLPSLSAPDVPRGLTQPCARGCRQGLWLHSGLTAQVGSPGSLPAVRGWALVGNEACRLMLCWLAGLPRARSSRAASQDGKDGSACQTSADRHALGK